MINTKNLRSEYDVWHQRVFDSDPEHEDASSPWYQLVREKLETVKGLDVLEVACGRGGFVHELRRRGARVVGCDFSMAALSISKERLRRLESKRCGLSLVQGDAQRLPFADESFDVVISCETVEHVPEPGSALGEMYRVARPGGWLYITTPNYLNFMGLYEFYALIVHSGRRGVGQPLDRRQWFPQIRRYIRHAGWTILHSDGTVHQFPFIPGHNPIGFPRLESNRVIRRLLSPFAFHYFVMAQKRSMT